MNFLLTATAAAAMTIAAPAGAPAAAERALPMPISPSSSTQLLEERTPSVADRATPRAALSAPTHLRAAAAGVLAISYIAG